MNTDEARRGMVWWYGGAWERLDMADGAGGCWWVLVSACTDEVERATVDGGLWCLLHREARLSIS